MPEKDASNGSYGLSTLGLRQHAKQVNEKPVLAILKLSPFKTFKVLQDLHCRTLTSPPNPLEVKSREKWYQKLVAPRNDAQEVEEIFTQRGY